MMKNSNWADIEMRKYSKNMIENEIAYIKCGCIPYGWRVYVIRSKCFNSIKLLTDNSEAESARVSTWTSFTILFTMHTSVWFVGRKWERLLFCQVWLLRTLTHIAAYVIRESSIDFHFYSTWLNAMFLFLFLFTLPETEKWMRDSGGVCATQ